MNSFIWNGKQSYEDFGIVINVLPPETIAEQDIETIEIVGRDGDLTVDHNAKKSYTLPMECTLIDFTRIDEIKAWLSGSGDLIFNWQSNYKYEARLNNKIDIEQSLAICGEFQLIFKVQPYKKAINNDLITLTTTPQIFFNNGTANSNPVITIYGTGPIDLNINDNVINFTNVSEYVTINSDLMDAYKGTLLMNQFMNGEFPELIPGNNTISFNGAITKIEILPNWRFI